MYPEALEPTTVMVDTTKERPDGGRAGVQERLRSTPVGMEK